MVKVISWLHKRYPQNILIKNPILGSLLFLIFCISFVLIYRPLDVRESRFLNFELTIAVYFIIASLSLMGLVKLLKHMKYFSDREEWTILKEILSIIISLLGTGVTIYFVGFLLEVPDSRWNLPTFFNSIFIAFLIGLVPFLFFSVINYRSLIVPDVEKSFNGPGSEEHTGQKIHITSRLKKEELEFYTFQFIYAESDGNYIIFHLEFENQVKKKTIRNSINNIEQQLSEIPYYFRTHRAYIVNTKKIISQKGNTLGYKLKLAGINTEIPVSRQKTRDFDRIMKQQN